MFRIASLVLLLASGAFAENAAAPKVVPKKAASPALHKSLKDAVAKVSELDLAELKPASHESSNKANSMFEIKAYFNSYPENPYNPFNNVEIHCFEKGDAGNNVYVRGNYGLAGYFEGPMMNNQAAVDFYEIYSDGSRPVTANGAAFLDYNLEIPDGPFIYAQNSFRAGAWGLQAECVDCLDDIDPGLAALAFCYWIPGTTGIVANGGGITFPNGQVFNTLGNQITFYATGVGAMETTGSWIGAYKYYYTPEDCQVLDCTGPELNEEHGHFGAYNQVLNGRTAKIVASSRHAVSGPAAGTLTSALIGTIANKDTSNQYRIMIGSFCVMIEQDGQLVGGPCTIYIFGGRSIYSPKVAKSLMGIYKDVDDLDLLTATFTSVFKP